MKKLIVLIGLLAVLVVPGMAQNEQAIWEYRIKELFQKGKYHEAINAQDDYYQQFPDNELMQMIRLYSWLQLYDLTNLKKDLDRMLEENPLLFSSQMMPRMLVDKKYLAEIFNNEFDNSYDLDPGRDYRPRLTHCDTVRGMLMPNRSCYDVRFYDLTLGILPDSRSIEGSNKIYFTVTEPTREIQVDLFKQYDIHSIMMEDAELGFERSCQAVFIRFDSELQPGEDHCLEIAYSGIPQEAIDPPWRGGFVWEKYKGSPWVGVACEHLGASSWWPLKDHLTDKPDSMRITLRVPEKLQAISNGNLRNITVNEDNTVSFEWFVSYPINSYNVTFYLGNFTEFHETYDDGESSFPIDYYVLKKNLKKAQKFYSTTKDILDVNSALFGPYPFPEDGAGFVEAPFAGMEHQGAIAIGDEYKGNFMGPQWVGKEHPYIVVHETAHEWWGNAVTIGDMADAWIHEGFATYCEYLLLEQKYGYEEYISAFGNNSQFIFNAWPMVGDRDVNDDTFLTGDIYSKGAAMLNNLRCIINDDSMFFALLKGFYNERKMKISSTEDFLEYYRRIYPKDLDEFFDVFLFGEDPPVLEYSFTLAFGTLIFNYHWIGVGEGFEMPFAIVVNDTTCIRMEGTTDVTNYTLQGAKSFYIPTPYYFSKKVMLPNSFTYFQTYWRRE